ncbi:hypothetical protein OQA88_3319 [Cercophora sp. LCS_1]
MSRNLFKLIRESVWEGLSDGITGDDDPEQAKEFTVPDCDDPSTTTPYKYTQLGALPRPFRLLHLLPGNGREPIACRLVHASLDDEVGTYESLSYVWGEAYAPVAIQVDDGVLHIGPNLRGAMLDLRHPDAVRVIWADAICINQEDDDERTRQVGSMGDIYSNASQTVIWMGPVSKEADKAFAMIDKLHNEAIEAKKNPGIIANRGGGSKYQEISTETPLESVFLKHPWWTRVWTAQEILLARRAMIVISKHQLDWDIFSTAITHGDAVGVFEMVVLGVVPSSDAQVFNDVHALRKIQETALHPADKFTWYLLRTRARTASDLRDKIFGVLGLLRDHAQEIRIQPDYMSPVADVYCEATRKLLASSSNFDILGFCQPLKNPVVDSLPSWVADWASSEYIATPLLEDYNRNRRECHASRGANAKPTWEDNGLTLVAEGHTVDIITKLSAVQTKYDEDAAWNFDDTLENPDDPWYKALKDAMGSLGQAYGEMVDMVSYSDAYLEWEEFAKDLKPTNLGMNASDPMLTYCLTLCTGIHAPGGLQETQKLFNEWIKSLSPIRKLRAWKMNPKGGTYRFLTLLGYFKSTWNGYGEFFRYIKSTTERRMGASAKGYLCLLPKVTEVGDRLVILKGGRFPVILRPRDDGSMQFVGEAYVHGIMDGETFEEEKCVSIRIR